MCNNWLNFKYKAQRMNKTRNKLLRPLAEIFAILRFNLYKLLHLADHLKYRKDYKQFQLLGGNITHQHEIISDFNAQAGSAKGHYFHQDLLVASLIHQKKPGRHIDIGSRVDGFVAHVASYREIEVIDVRDLEHTGHKNIVFKKADLMASKNPLIEATDSLSCLHVIEHFGLGRYGDPVDPLGHIKGFNNILKMLKSNGTLYISFPIGRKNEIHFNAHRVFHPNDIFNWAYDKNSLSLERFDYVDDAGDLHQNFNLSQGEIDVSYGCGIYSFIKN